MKSLDPETGAKWNDKPCLCKYFLPTLKPIAPRKAEKNEKKTFFIKANKNKLNFPFPGLDQRGRRLESWPNTAARLAGWRRVTQQGVILSLMVYVACPEGRHHLQYPPCLGLIFYWMFTEHRQELRHPKKAWPGTLVDPYLLSGLSWYVVKIAAPHVHCTASQIWSSCLVNLILIFRSFLPNLSKLGKQPTSTENTLKVVNHEGNSCIMEVLTFNK
jgi:hypothetical protein